MIKSNKDEEVILSLSPDFILTLQHIHLCHVTKKQYAEKSNVVYN
jgi:hypothetical protein